MFRVGGENVAPAEVEEVLLAHPAVRDRAGVGVPDARLGEVPCAYVTLKANQSASEAELIAMVQERGAPTSACRATSESSTDFEAIGMTASGKVQKTKLREHALRELNLQ